MNKATTVLAPPGAGYLRGEARERAEPLEMLADEYLLEGQGERARTGILLIHGLTGTPNEMRVLARGLHLQGYTVYAVKLAGHCGTLDDLVGTSWLDWLASVRRGADLLSRRVDRVVVGGLSMGAVLALALAQERPEHIAGVLALSPAFRHDGWSMPRYTKLACLLPVMRALGIGRRSVFMEQPPYGIKDALRARVVSQMHAGDSAASGLPGNPGGRWWKCTSWRARCCATCRAARALPGHARAQRRHRLGVERLRDPAAGRQRARHAATAGRQLSHDHHRPRASGGHRSRGGLRDRAGRGREARGGADVE